MLHLYTCIAHSCPGIVAHVSYTCIAHSSPDIMYIASTLCQMNQFLDKYGVKLGFMSFFTKAAITVLKEIPEINSEIKGNSIIYKNRYDIGIAVGTERGLYVPVIRNADRMSFSNIEEEILKYGKMAKDNKLTMEHMKEGTFTISNETSDLNILEPAASEVSLFA